MLILTRRQGEMIKIGQDIEVSVLGVKGGQVRIGITAPKAMAVDREEVRERKDAGMNPVLHLPQPIRRDVRR